MDRVVVESVGEEDGGGSEGSEDRQRLGGMVAGLVAEENESGGESGEGEGGPGKKREEPGLGSAQVVASVNVGLDRPGEPGGTPCGIERRSEQGDEGGSGEGGGDERNSKVVVA